MANSVKKTIENAKDKIDEARHVTTADIERAKREVAGEQMTAGQKVKSVVREGSERAKAGIDKAKRAVRDRT